MRNVVPQTAVGDPRTGRSNVLPFFTFDLSEEPGINTILTTSNLPQLLEIRSIFPKFGHLPMVREKHTSPNPSSSSHATAAADFLVLLFSRTTEETWCGVDYERDATASWEMACQLAGEGVRERSEKKYRRGGGGGGM